MTREPVHLRHADWATGAEFWRGRFEGRDIGTGVTVLFFASDEQGAGPKLHKHPYDEVFIIRQGRALFTIGERQIEVGAGDVLLGPAGVPHKFVNIGEGRLETTDIHLSETWVQEDLEDPEV